MLNPVREVKKALARKAVDNIFKIAERSKLLDKNSTVSIDVFNSGIIINLSKTARKIYPRIVPALRELLEREIKKL